MSEDAERRRRIALYGADKPIDAHDADTLAYLQAAGISGALLDRVRRLAERAHELSKS